jgi:peptide/nickel transport system permease protein
MSLRQYLTRRSLQLLPVILAVIVITFLLVQLAPGDVAIVLAGEDPSPEFMEKIRKKYGLDQPIHVQFWEYFKNVIKGDLGTSFVYNEPVIDIILRRLPATLLLVLSSLVISAILGTLVGAYLAYRSGRVEDISISIFAVALYSMPVFWLGLMLILIFGVNLDWLPIAGMFSPLGPREGWGRIVDVGKHLILPAATLSSIQFAYYLRLSRASVGETLAEDYIVSAKAVGYSDRVVLLKHALRNALLPVVTVFGMQVGLVLTGAVLTETVFAWPGMGRMVYQAILARDTPLIVGALIIISLCVLVSSLITDIIYFHLDPRVRVGSGR